MRRMVVLVAAVVALAGCGAEAEPSAEATGDATSAASESASQSPSDSPSPDPSDAGDEGSSSQEPEATAVPAGTPACDTVWVDGTRLARSYSGCRVGARFVEPDQEPCSFGQRLVRYGDHFYAVRGGPVNRTTSALGKDRAYRSALKSCRA